MIFWRSVVVAIAFSALFGMQITLSVAVGAEEAANQDRIIKMVANSTADASAKAQAQYPGWTVVTVRKLSKNRKSRAYEIVLTKQQSHFGNDWPSLKEFLVEHAWTFAKDTRRIRFEKTGDFTITWSETVYFDTAFGTSVEVNEDWKMSGKWAVERQEPTLIEKQKLSIPSTQSTKVYFLTLTVDEYSRPEPVGDKSKVRSINDIQAILNSRKKITTTDILFRAAFDERQAYSHKFRFIFRPVKENNTVMPLVSFKVKEGALLLNRPKTITVNTGRPQQQK